MDAPTAAGRLEVVCGPMFAGKTTELIRRLRAAQGSGAGVVAVRPVHDTRSPADVIRTHAGETLAAVALRSAAEVAGLADGPGGAALVLGIDEAHFFGKGLIAPVRSALARGVRVIVAGVERDHTGEPFEPFPTLLCEADEVLKLAARCAVCGGRAVHSQRLIDSSERIVAGGAESYEARCRRCFRPGPPAR